MKFQVSLLVVSLASFPALAQTETQVAQLNIKGGEQMMRPNPGSPAVNATLPPEANEVAKMSKAGVSEGTMLNYVATTPPATLSAEDVLTLHHKGVPLTVITAMLHRRGDQTAPVTPETEPRMATVPRITGPNAPIVYPTPAKEAVPLTDPVVVIYGGNSSGYAYDSPSVIISRSSFYQGGYQGSGFSGGISTITTYPSVPYSGGFYRYGPGYRSYSCGYGSPGYCSSSRSCDYGYRRGRW
jgi:hypothetical protein